MYLTITIHLLLQKFYFPRNYRLQKDCCCCGQCGNDFKCTFDFDV